MPAGSSFAAILVAFKDFIEVVPDYPFGLAIVIRREAELSRNEAGQILRENLPEFTLTPIPIAVE